MCGIVAYVGPNPAYPIVIEGLKRLEYRGYDSAGVATIEQDGSLQVSKKKGKVDDLTTHIGAQTPSGSVGIGIVPVRFTDAPSLIPLAGSSNTAPTLSSSRFRANYTCPSFLEIIFSYSNFSCTQCGKCVYPP